MTRLKRWWDDLRAKSEAMQWRCRRCDAPLGSRIESENVSTWYCSYECDESARADAV